jgi:hypothetical protein
VAVDGIGYRLIVSIRWSQWLKNHCVAVTRWSPAGTLACLLVGPALTGTDGVAPGDVRRVRIPVVQVEDASSKCSGTTAKNPLRVRHHQD